AEAEAAMTTAATPAAMLQAYAAAPPTVKARQASSLGAEVERVTATEATQWQADVPDLHATLSGAESAATQAPVLAPPARSVDLAAPVGPTPEPQITEVPSPGAFRAEEDVTRAFSFLTDPEPDAFAQQIGDSLSDVQTADPDVPRSPGPPPAIPLGGETDPARVAKAEAAARQEAATARGDAAQAVIDGPGPERVQPRAMDETFVVGELPSPVIGAGPGPEGPEAFLAMELPPEVQVAFDEQQGPGMEQSMAAAVTQSEQATADRDAAKQTAVSDAETGLTQLNQDADARQSQAVRAARTDIQASRQDTLDAQQREVDRVQSEADAGRRAEESAIQTRVEQGRAEIDSAYAGAERDISAEVVEGERKAEAKKAEAEREAADRSWWERAVSWVKDAFNALVDAIGAVFDAVRSVVNGILDAVKAVALAAIDAVATFIKDAIAAFGELLKAAITGLIGQVFPELAAKLNAAIDSAVTAAQNAVDVVADGLKAGVSALVEGLRAGIMAALNTFQAALTVVLSVAYAAITGDWGELARRVLESVLRLIGVDPESFYAFVGRSQETFQIIVDDPGGFLGNVLAAVSGGIQRFADHIVTHLQSGVIGWLTGTLSGAGIVLPQSFDLLGVLDLARQVLGLSWDWLRARARRLVGEANVERLEAALGLIETLVTEGWGGLWRRITDAVATIRDVVFSGIETFIRDRVIIAAVTKLATMFNPIGAIAQLVLTAWNIYTFLRDQLARIVEVVQSVTAAIDDVARGVLEGAALAVENVLGRLLPLAIDLLARVLGLGNVGASVREIVEQVREMINKGIDGLLERVAAAFKGGAPGGPAGAPAASPAGTATEGAPGAPSGGTISETFIVAGEEHTLRSVVVGDEATTDMASASFGPLASRLNSLIKTLAKTYLTPGGPKYLGGTEATVAADKLEEIRARATTLVADLAAAKAPPGADQKALAKAALAERKIVRDGFNGLRVMLEALKLPEARAEALHPGHGPRAGGVASYGRRLSFQVNPLSVASLDKGGSAQDPVPGVRVLPGYDRGHLVARSLGGPGTPDNLVPLSKAANTERVGIQAVEDSLRKALRHVAAHPELYPVDNPMYVFSYSVSVTQYHEPGALQDDLVARGVTDPGSRAGLNLFALAQSASNATPTDQALLTAVEPRAGLDAGTLAKLPDNLRRRLAYHFHPVQLLASVQVLHEPTDERTKFPIHTGGRVDTHLGVDVQWHA
ncbi:MAG: DNA/RNA non-specific endonuclease, partial [Candidatus Nanopelagicales bacterium]